MFFPLSEPAIFSGTEGAIISGMHTFCSGKSKRFFLEHQGNYEISFLYIWLLFFNNFIVFRA